MRQHGGEQSGLVTLTFDLLTLKVVSAESHVTWATCVPILVFLGLSVLDLGPMYATDRQTDVRQHHRLMPRLLGAGHNKYGDENICRFRIKADSELSRFIIKHRLLQVCFLTRKVKSLTICISLGSRYRVLVLVGVLKLPSLESQPVSIRTLVAKRVNDKLV